MCGSKQKHKRNRKVTTPKQPLVTQQQATTSRIQEGKTYNQAILGKRDNKNICHKQNSTINSREINQNG